MEVELRVVRMFSFPGFGGSLIRLFRRGRLILRRNGGLWVRGGLVVRGLAEVREAWLPRFRPVRSPPTPSSPVVVGAQWGAGWLPGRAGLPDGRAGPGLPEPPATARGTPDRPSCPSPRRR